MNYAQELTEKYAAFYRPRLRRGKPSSNAAVKPLKIASRILLHPDNLRMENAEIVEAIAAECSKLMGQIHRNTAEGFWVSSGDAERTAIYEFARFFVMDFFLVGCMGRRDLLSGNKFATVEHTCEWLIQDEKYRLTAK